MKYHIGAIAIVGLATLNIVAILRLAIIDTGPALEDIEQQALEIRSQNLIPELDAALVMQIEGAVEAQTETDFRFIGNAIIQNAQGIPINDAILTYQFITSNDVQILQSRTNANGEAIIDVFFSDRGTYRVEILDITGEGIQLDRELSEQLNLTQSHS